MITEKGFVHLHLHSQYSLLDGAVRFNDLFKQCSELGMDSVALTDHGNMFGVIEFYTKARKMHIKPIIGIEAYLAPDSRFEKQKAGGISDAAYHLILLAENNTGYRNLLKLASIGYTEGFYYRPRIDKEILAELSEGLICTSACLKGQIARTLAVGDEKHAIQAAQSYLEIFGYDRFFIEVQQHEGSDAPEVRDMLIDLAGKMGIGMVVTNDVHFLNSEDHDAHDALCCINTGTMISNPNRLRYPTDVYLKSPSQMREIFADIPQACDNTLAIAQRCEVELDLKTRHAPKYIPPDGSSAEEYLTRLCFKGAKKLYKRVTGEIKSRLDRELEVIAGKGFASYFLIVWDFCDFARRNNIPVGARGSGVGTLAGYCLGLCDVDPLRYDLLFERFMDPQRDEMPDIDIDICQDGRAKVIDYVRQKYGQVAQIITFGTMKARAVIRDVCRVMDVPLAEADRLAKLVPATLGITLDTAIETEPDLKKAYEENEQTRRVINICKKIEGLCRHASVHAAGVVVADEPLTDFVPLYKQSGSDDLITQFDGPTVEQVGLLKIDFLGLRTLSVIERAKELVEMIHGEKIDLQKISLDDPKVFAIFGSGRTKGVFQFESGGMQDLLMKLKPDRIEDLIAANALYRPGPMTLIGDFIDRKHGVKWEVPHPIMHEILEETFGIMIYQEQVMRICNRLGDIPLREAYTLIKAISKKKLKVIAKERERFIKGCVEKGLDERQAAEIFELIERFAGYGFNKSHSTRYAFIAYQTAYMKAYWPVEFMAALLTYEMGSTDKIVEYISECKDMNIEVAPPDINESFTDFTVVYEQGREDKATGMIRFGLGAVKGVGEKAVEQIIKARQETGRFKSLFHFCETVDLRVANKQVIDALIKAGVFDRLGGSRHQMIAGLEKAMEIGARAQSDAIKGQMTFFSDLGGDEKFEQDKARLPDVPAWSEMQMLNYEKDVLGFYITRNPLSRHAETIGAYSSVNTGQLDASLEGREIVIGGMIKNIRNIVTRNGRNAGAKMAVAVLEDLQGTVEVVFFPDALEENSEQLLIDNIVFIRGKVDCRREVPNIIAGKILPLEDAEEKLTAEVHINLTAADITTEKVNRIKSICMSHRGNSPVYVSLRTEKGRVSMVAGDGFHVKPDVEFCRKMRQLVGVGNFDFGKCDAGTGFNR
ncbi:MAG: DNA polymerase III subunit alpha [Planctomycetota bacterium]